MKVAIVGSRGLNFDIPEYCIPENTDQIISGGAKGIDRKAREYAQKHHIELIEILPEYNLYGKRAPLERNDIIVEIADLVIAFWDGKSNGTRYVINKCRSTDTPVHIYNVDSMREPDFS